LKSLRRFPFVLSYVAALLEFFRTIGLGRRVSRVPIMITRNCPG